MTSDMSRRWNWDTKGLAGYHLCHKIWEAAVSEALVYKRELRDAIVRYTVTI